MKSMLNIDIHHRDIKLQVEVKTKSILAFRLDFAYGQQILNLILRWISIPVFSVDYVPRMNSDFNFNFNFAFYHARHLLVHTVSPYFVFAFYWQLIVFMLHCFQAFVANSAT